MGAERASFHAVVEIEVDLAFEEMEVHGELQRAAQIVEDVDGEEMVDADDEDAERVVLDTVVDLLQQESGLVVVVALAKISCAHDKEAFVDSMTFVVNFCVLLFLVMQWKPDYSLRYQRYCLDFQNERVSCLLTMTTIFLACTER